MGSNVKLIAVILLLGQSIVTSGETTIQYPSSTSFGVETSSGDGFSIVDVESTEPVVNGSTTTDAGSGDGLSTTPGGWTETVDNGQTTDGESGDSITITSSENTTPSDGEVTTGTTTLSEGEATTGTTTLSEGEATTGTTTLSEGEPTTGTTTLSEGKATTGTTTLSEDEATTGTTTLSEGEATTGTTTLSEGEATTGTTTLSEGEATTGTTTLSEGEATTGTTTLSEGEATTGTTTLSEGEVTTGTTTTAAVGTSVLTEQITSVLPSSPATPSVTTTVPSTTTTAIPPNIQPPNFGAAPPFNMTFSIGFDKLWTGDFSDENCPTNADCLAFKSEVQIEVNKAFENCTGYKNNSVQVLSFRRGGEITQRRVRSLKYFVGIDALVTGTENDTFADYITSFANEQILHESGSQEIVDYIGSYTVQYLQDADFNGVQALDESLTTMTATAQNQIDSFANVACPMIGHYVCPICFPCSYDDYEGFNISCKSTCTDNEICTLSSDNTTGCSCKDNYLPVAGDCVDQNIIIGVSAGVGGAIVLGLIIALIIVGCKLDKKDKDYDHLKKTQEYRPASYTSSKVHDTETAAAAAADLYTDIHAVKHRSPAHDDNGQEMELATFSTVVETDAAPIAVAAAVHASQQQQQQHPADDAESHKGNGSVAVRHAKDDMKPDYDNASSHSIAAAAGEDKKASSSSHQSQKPGSSEHYKDLYYDDPLSEEDPYAGFVPRLATVDTKNEYIIARPKFDLQPSRNFKDINSQFF